MAKVAQSEAQSISVKLPREVKRQLDVIAMAEGSDPARVIEGFTRDWFRKTPADDLHKKLVGTAP